MSIRLVLSVTAALIFVSAPSYAGIKGTVGFTGKAPAPKPIDMKSDPKCKTVTTEKMTNDTLIKDNKVENAFLYVKNPPKKKYKAPKDRIVLDQKGCRFHPKVFGIMQRQKLEILNNDPLLHNVNGAEFNLAMPKQGMKLVQSFRKAMVMRRIKCDVHGWMAAYAGVMSHPYYAVSDAKGQFEIPTADLPDGEYEVGIWHETLGEKSAKVKVAGGNATIDFTLSK